MDLLCMLAPTWRRPWISVNWLFKYIYLNNYEILSKTKIVSTLKLCDQPFSSLSSCLMCWMGSILFSFLQQNNWNLVFQAIFNFVVHKRMNQWLHICNVHCFWNGSSCDAIMLSCVGFPLIFPLEFSWFSWKTKKTN